MRNVPMSEIIQMTEFPEKGINLWIQHKIVSPCGQTIEPGKDEVSPVFDPSNAFALFVGSRYRKENAPAPRVEGVVKFLSGVTTETFLQEIAAGRTFPVPAVLVRIANGFERLPNQWKPGMFIPPPDTLDLRAAFVMNRLDLKKLWDEFNLILDRN